jgi:hypothetical protein
VSEYSPVASKNFQALHHTLVTIQLSGAFSDTERLAAACLVEHVEDSPTLLASRREIGANAAELPRPLLVAEAPGSLLLQLHHPQVSLCLIVIEGYGEVRQKE